MVLMRFCRCKVLNQICLWMHTGSGFEMRGGKDYNNNNHVVNEIPQDKQAQLADMKNDQRDYVLSSLTSFKIFLLASHTHNGALS